MSSVGKTFVAFLVGAAAGAATGLLMAPTSGKRLRKQLSDAGIQYYGEAENTWNQGVDKVRNGTNQARDAVNKTVDKFGKVVQN